MKSAFSFRHWSVATIVIGSVTAIGCGKAKEPWEKVYPATGVVVYDGKPLAGAQLTLIPEDSKFPGSVRPRATTKDDGTYELSTYGKGDGAPEGSYKAVVLRYPVVGSKESPSPGPNDLPVKYARAETTDLKLQVSATTPKIAELQLEKKTK